MATFNPAANTDDARERENDTNFETGTGGGLIMGVPAGGLPQAWYSGHRFVNVTIPQGSSIDTAYVTFTADAANAGNPGGEIYAHASDNAPTFSAGDDIVNRSRTTNSASWTTPNIIVDDTADTSSLVLVIQEIVNRPGWSSGNAIALLFLTDSGNASDQWDAYTYADGDTAKDPVLTVTWSAATSTTSTTSTSTSTTTSTSTSTSTTTSNTSTSSTSTSTSTTTSNTSSSSTTTSATSTSSTTTAPFLIPELKIKTFTPILEVESLTLIRRSL